MTAEKVRENRLRRMAERQGLALRKSPRRDPFALDYGRWWIVEANDDPLTAQVLVHGNAPSGLSLDQVEAYLTRSDKGGE